MGSFTSNKTLHQIPKVNTVVAFQAIDFFCTYIQIRLCKYMASLPPMHFFYWERISVAKFAVVELLRKNSANHGNHSTYDLVKNFPTVEELIDP